AGNTKPTQAPTKAHAAGKKIRLPTYPNHTKLDVVLGRLRKNSTWKRFVSGHDFSRAEKADKEAGF
ncbi:MAG: hypothetical protein WBE41_22490, partial [Terracidiphilus sp.]